MSKLIEEINKVINKIDENTSKESLDKNEVEQILNDIDDGLVEIKEGAEEKHIRNSGEKIEELRDKMDDGLTKNWRWGRVKGVLSGIKQYLEELRNEVEKSEQSLVIRKSGGELVVRSGSEVEELAEWRVAFPGQNAEFVLERINKLEGFAAEQVNLVKKNHLTIAERIRPDSKETFTVEMSKHINDFAREYVRLGEEVGEKSGMAPIVTPVASALGAFVALPTQAAFVAALGTTEAFVSAGVGIIDKTGSDLRDLTEEGMEGLKEVTEKGMEIGADVIIKSIDGATEITRSFWSVFNNQETIESLKEKIETLGKLLEKREEEFKKRLGNRDKQIENKNKEIDELRERKNKEIEDLRERGDERIKNLQEQKNEEINRLQKMLDFFMKSESTAKVEQSSNN